jgi:hypothetical protein
VLTKRCKQSSFNIFTISSHFLLVARCIGNIVSYPSHCDSHLPFIGEVTSTGSWLGSTFSERPYSESRQRSPHPFCKSRGQAHTWRLRSVTSREQNFKIDPLLTVGVRIAPDASCGRQRGSETRSIPVKKVILLSGRQETMTSCTFLLRSYVIMDSEDECRQRARNWFCDN